MDGVPHLEETVKRIRVISGVIWTQSLTSFFQFRLNLFIYGEMYCSGKQNVKIVSHTLGPEYNCVFGQSNQLHFLAHLRQNPKVVDQGLEERFLFNKGNQLIDLFERPPDAIRSFEQSNNKFPAMQTLVFGGLSGSSLGIGSASQLFLVHQLYNIITSLILKQSYFCELQTVRFSSHALSQDLDVHGCIIKLMKSTIRLQREIPHLNQQDFKKIFPEEYYSKYAAHQKLIKFEQDVFKQTHNPAPTLTRRQSTPHLTNSNPAAITKLNRFDQPAEVIQKNKEQTKRMEGFVKDLNSKLRRGPQTIEPKMRSPLTGFAAIPEGVFQRIKLLQDAQYQAELQLVRQKRGKAREYVSFVKRGNNSTSASRFQLKMDNKSIIGQSIQSKSIKDYNEFNIYNAVLLHSIQHISNHQPEGPSSFLPYHERVKDIVNHTRSQIVLLNPESRNTDRKTIMAMNRSIKKINGLKDELVSQRRRLMSNSAQKKIRTMSSNNSGGGQGQKKRKDLVAMTHKVREQVDNLQMLSHYKNAIDQRNLKLKLQQIK